MSRVCEAETGAYCLVYMVGGISEPQPLPLSVKAMLDLTEEASLPKAGELPLQLLLSCI